MSDTRSPAIGAGAWRRRPSGAGERPTRATKADRKRGRQRPRAPACPGAGLASVALASSVAAALPEARLEDEQTEVTVVLADNDEVANLLGTHDRNLKAIERGFDARIVARGNQAARSSGLRVVG